MTLQLVSTKEETGLDVDAVLRLLDADGPLSSALKGFESRPEQKLMMANVLEAFTESHIALIEAGTGTGKSLAYLIPAMLWAIQTKERTVISTNTITLQEQLLQKDIPVIAKTLNLEIKSALVKGMHNYLCMRKLDEAMQESLLLLPAEVEELQKLDAWSNNTRDGSRSSLRFSCSSGTWEKVAAESDTCNRNSCPHFQKCHFFKARRYAADAQILVVNHHLLFADLVMRQESEIGKDSGILPAYSRIVIDEAHNIEDIATEYFASKTSQMDIIRLLARFTAEKGGKVFGKLPLLKEKLVQSYREKLPPAVTSIYNRLNLELPGMRRDLLQLMHEMFSAFFEFTHLMRAETAKNEERQGESKLRLLPQHHANSFWQERILPTTKLLVEAFKKYIQAMSALESDLKQLFNPKLDEAIKGILFELNALTMRLKGCSTILESFTTDSLPAHRVRWIELQTFKTMVNTSLVDAGLDIANLLVELLFSKMSTVILCSATLTTNKEFTFIRNRLGLTPALTNKLTIKEHSYDSPFNFAKQVLLAVPDDLPNPTDPAFIQEATESIWHYINSSRGNAFVLFTSYSMLKTCYSLLENRMKEGRFHPLKQGDSDRIFLLNKFKTTERSVLFGTDSFWEGVDVAGDALRLVILVKLPFKVPSEPLIQARAEDITANGGDPFMDYSLPQAIVKFKQGFGRLIRNCNDRGCIICLDNRLTTKRYGQLFLKSLPKCKQLFSSSKAIAKEMTDFYRKTYYLTKK